MMRKSVLLLVLFVIISQACNTQNKEPVSLQQKVKVGLTVTGWNKQPVVVKMHQGKQVLVLDTIHTDQNGHTLFTVDSLLPGGLYLFTFPGKKWFVECIIDENNYQFDIQTDTVDFFQHIKAKHSKENAALFEFQLENNRFRKLSRQYTIAYRKNIKNADSTKKYKALYETLSKTHQKQLEHYAKKYKGRFLATIVNASRNITIPEAPNIDSIPKEKRNRYIQAFRYRYLQDHFFDYIDFSDARLIHTSILANKIDEYFRRIVSTQPDTLIKKTEALLAKAKANEAVYRFVFQFILENVERGGKWYDESLFLHLATHYVLAGKTPWISKALMAQVKFQYGEMAPTITGKPFPTLTLTNVMTKKDFVVDDIKAPLTIVYFWSDQCGHCKRYTPGFHKLYQKYKNKGLVVVAVTATNDFKEWVRYFVKHKYTDWINAYYKGDYNRMLHLYNIYMTPHTFVLDENKTIIKKDPRLDELETLLKTYLDK